MFRQLITVFCLGMLAVACNRNKNEVANADDAKSPIVLETDQGGQETAEKTQIAEGEIKELLLALRRVHFSLDSEQLLPDAKDALEEAAQKLVAQEGINLHVDGHTDERGTTEHNMALGHRRAKTVIDYLTRLGVSGEMLTLNSHGEESPLASGHDMLSYAKNRRVEFRLMKGDVRFILEPGTLVDDQGNRIDQGASDESVEDTADEGAQGAVAEEAEPSEG